MKKSVSLELAILGLLSQGALHGYELRKRVNLILGPLRAISFGALYPELKRLCSLNYIEQKEDKNELRFTKRGRISYQVTLQGTERLNEILRLSGPETWDDGTFTIYLSFFTKLAASARLQILLGRKIRLEERIRFLQDQLIKTDQQLDQYTIQINSHNIDSVKKEINWIDELISSERKES